MRRITVELDARSIERLRELAERERRDLRQQAAWLILRGLEERPAKRQGQTR